MRRKTYALFMAMPDNEISNRILKGAALAAEEMDANLVVFPVGYLGDPYYDNDVTVYRYQYRVLNEFFKSDVIDGAVVEYGSITSTLDENEKKEYLAEIGDMKTVLLGDAVEGYKGVYYDNEAGLKEVIEHLITDHGLTKIGFFSGPKGNHDASCRLNAYRDVMASHGLEVLDRYIAYGNFSTYCEEMVEEYLENNSDIEAIAFANDDMAIGAYNVMERMGIVPGVDIKVTGFDDQSGCVLMRPAITTVNADPAELSYNAIVALDNEEIEDVQIIPTRMVKRQSCGCKNRLLLDAAGEVMGVASEEEYRENSKKKLIEAKKEIDFVGELELAHRAVVFAQKSGDDWMIPVLDAYNRMGAKNTFIFFYDEPIDNKIQNKWEVPATMELRASYKDGIAEIYEKGEKRVDTLNVFDSHLVKTGRRSLDLVLPLFYMDKQMGLIITEIPAENVLYAYQLTNQISTTIEMVSIQEDNIRIQRELELANKAKSQFLANMSHEIRTPINAILGMDEMILREGINPDVVGFAKDIHNATESLLSIVNDILDMSKIEAGKLSLVPVPYRLDVLLTDIIKQMQFKAAEKDIELRLNMDLKLPSMLHGDDIRFRQIIMNLLSNGIKYTNHGYVELSVKGHLVDDEAVIMVVVSDTGIGIKPEDIGRLYGKFERLEEERNRSIEGTGLGMSIINGLLELMGSELKVKSEYGKGSKFSFVVRQPVVSDVPIEEVSDYEAEAKNKEYKESFRAPKAKVLVVDDNDVNRLVISRLLKKTDVQIDEAINGLDCTEKYVNNDYDLILMDHMMPVMDGAEALRRIQALTKYKANPIPIIVLTANAIVGVEQEYLRQGFDAYLSKPVRPAKLDEILLRFLPKEKIIIEE